ETLEEAIRASPWAGEIGIASAQQVRQVCRHRALGELFCRGLIAERLIRLDGEQRRAVVVAIGIRLVEKSAGRVADIPDEIPDHIVVFAIAQTADAPDDLALLFLRNR